MLHWIILHLVYSVSCIISWMKGNHLVRSFLCSWVTFLHYGNQISLGYVFLFFDLFCNWNISSSSPLSISLEQDVGQKMIVFRGIIVGGIRSTSSLIISCRQFWKKCKFFDGYTVHTRNCTLSTFLQFLQYEAYSILLFHVLLVFILCIVHRALFLHFTPLRVYVPLHLSQVVL